MVEQMTETHREQFEKEEQMISDNDVVASISFGRFENDLLSWERWSSFSQNKYMEEVEKCSTPGSVASKKAYFEAHYKKIAARKAELLEQEQKLENDSPGSNYPTSRNQSENGSNFEFDTPRVDLVSSARNEERNEVEDCLDCEDLFTLDIKEEMGTQRRRSFSQKSDEAVSVKEEHLLTRLQVRSEEVALVDKEDNNSEGLQVRSEEVALVDKEDNNSEGLQAQVEELPDSVADEKHSTGALDEPKELPVVISKENKLTISEARSEEVNVELRKQAYSSGSKPKTSKSQVNKAGNTKLKPQRESQKIVQKSPAPKDPKERTIAKTKHKPERPATKQAPTSVPRVAKSSPDSRAISTSKNTIRKESSPSLLSKKNVSTTGSKRSTSASLGKSLNEAPKKADSSFLNTTRRSLIMERMGDKDIVKRVFKAFQNNYDPSKPRVNVVSSAPQQISDNGTTQIASSLPQGKDTERKGRPTRKLSNQRKQVGGKSNSLSSGPARASIGNQTNTKATPSSSFIMGNEERVEKRRETLKKTDEKSKAKEVESIHLRPTSKDGANTRRHHRP